MKFKSRTASAIAPIFITLGFSCQAYASGIPVVDGAHIAKTTMNHIESIAKYVEQIEKLKAQLDQMKQQYEALTGLRNLGQIMFDPKFKDYLPTEWKGVYDSMRSGGYSGISSSAKAIYDAAKRFDGCKHNREEIAKLACQARAVKGAQDKAFAMEAFDRAKDRLSQIEELMRTIDTTTDPKAIAELQARIMSEQAAIQNEATKLQMFQMISAAEERMQQQQQREINAERASRRGSINIPAVTFD